MTSQSCLQLGVAGLQPEEVKIFGSARPLAVAEAVDRPAAELLGLAADLLAVILGF